MAGRAGALRPTTGTGFDGRIRVRGSPAKRLSRAAYKQRGGHREMTLLCAPLPPYSGVQRRYHLHRARADCASTGVASGHRRPQIQTPFTTAKPPQTGVHHLPRTPRPCVQRSAVHARAARVAHHQGSLQRPYCAGTTLARGALEHRLVCSLA